MELFLLLVTLAGGIHASPAPPETHCDMTNFFLLPCTPELGGTVFIRLMDNATGYILVFTKNLPGRDLKVFIVKEGKVKIRKEYRNRTEFSIDTGTLEIRDAEKSDTGQYSLKILTPQGLFVQMFSFNLEVREQEKKHFSIRIPVYVEVGVPLFVVVVCVVICIVKPWRQSGYQRLN